MLRLIILRFAESFFRHSWLYLLPILLASAAGGSYLALAEPSYLSSGTMYVRRDLLLSSLTQLRNDGFVWSTAANVTAVEIRDLSTTEAFVRAVLNETDLRDLLNDPEQADEVIKFYRESLIVTAIGDNLVKFSVESNSNTLSQQLAVATVMIYKNWKLNIDQKESIAAQKFFAEIIGPYKTEFETAQTALTNYLKQNPDPVRGNRPLTEELQIQQYQAAVSSADERLQSALEKEEAARLALAQAQTEIDQSYAIVDTPNLPLEPELSLKQTVLLMGVSIIVGVMLCVFGIVGGALLDRTLRVPEDVRMGLHLPVLALIEDGRPIMQERERAALKALKRQPKSEHRDTSAVVEPTLDDQPVQAAGN